ncbi:---NA--- [Octopus vulgaris]|uniref:---NA n=1 Tax=Octopus vulgaris TaxID=6645 RepID=A0AA36F8M5_OCTVU|nr:---NA--- [Octopus vulgaris]
MELPRRSRMSVIVKAIPRSPCLRLTINLSNGDTIPLHTDIRFNYLTYWRRVVYDNYLGNWRRQERVVHRIETITKSRVDEASE